MQDHQKCWPGRPRCRTVRWPTLSSAGKSWIEKRTVKKERWDIEERKKCGGRSGGRDVKKEERKDEPTVGEEAATRRQHKPMLKKEKEVTEVERWYEPSSPTSFLLFGSWHLAASCYRHTDLPYRKSLTGHANRLGTNGRDTRIESWDVPEMKLSRAIWRYPWSGIGQTVRYPPQGPRDEFERCAPGKMKGHECCSGRLGF